MEQSNQYTHQTYNYSIAPQWYLRATGSSNKMADHSLPESLYCLSRNAGFEKDDSSNNQTLCHDHVT